MFNPDFYPTPPAALNARYARIKGQVLPEQQRRAKRGRKVVG